MNREQVKSSIVQNEGSINHLYLDTRGNATIGVGQLIASVESAKSLNLVVRETGDLATEQEIEQEYTNIVAQKVGMVASRYKDFTKLELSQKEIDLQLDRHIDEFVSSLERKVDNFEQFPDPAQNALLDMAFNLGVSGLVKKFPKLIQASNQQDWQTCAAECKRRGISDQRNQETKSLFESVIQA